ncbi:MAG: 4-hydroxy-tetrahydrodipicolinate synthase [Promethearchaeota archaeon]|nr:MAG: 4-hydroxy-tetrahydrodipicolinate synthase [Candidatus Lokiarchaeota archaeon]
MKLDKLKNVITALLTPFKEDFSLDEDKYREFIRFQIDNGAQLLTMGTTGECATLSHEEHKKAIDVTIDEASKSGKNPFVLAGTGSNSTSEAISLSKYAEKAGADGLLIVVPYYNKPVQHSLIDHYSKIANSVSLPIIIYNVPGRTGGNIDPETIATLAEENENIAGIKCASGNIDQITRTIKLTPKDFIVLSGDDAMTYHLMALGGKGVISVASNIIPKRMVEFTTTMNEGNWNKAREMHLELYDLFKVLFVETNPGPVKYAAEELELMNERMRLPLTPPLKDNKKKIKSILKDLDILEGLF